MNTNTVKTTPRTYRFEAVSEAPLPGGVRAHGCIEEALVVEDHVLVDEEFVERWARHRTVVALRRDHGQVQATQDMVQIVRLTWGPA